MTGSEIPERPAARLSPVARLNHRLTGYTLPHIPLQAAGMRTVFFSMILAVLVSTGFVAGMYFQQWRYEDSCRDLGGGRNPGSYPICVIEKAAERPASDRIAGRLDGSWILQGADFGFTLYDDGSASSINSATLITHRWRLDRDRLCLTRRSIGNHQQFVEEDCRPFRLADEGSREASLTWGHETYQRP